MPIKKLLNDHVLVKRIEKKGNRTQGGIIMSPHVDITSYREVEIVQLPDEISDYQVGDTAYIGLYAGMDCNIDGEDMAIIKLGDIILIV